MRAFIHIGFIAIGCGAAFGQSAVAPKFDLADVHVAVATGNNAQNMSGGFLRGGRYEVKHATIVDLVRTAWGVDADKVVGGPSWLEMDRFDVIATAPAATPPETVKLMLRSLLAERFKLVVHDDIRPMPAYALTAGKKPQIKEADGSGDTGCKFEQQGGPGGRSGPPAEGSGPPPLPTFVYNCHNITMTAFADGMRNMVVAQQYLNNNPVVDQTGLKGSWDFTFKYSIPSRMMIVNGAPSVSEGLTLFDAIDKQLGLKLELTKAPLPVVVVDSVERTPTPNAPGVTKSLPDLPVEFEVADVKPSDPDFKGMMFQIQQSGRINLRGVPMKFMIEQAWNLTDDMIVGAPKWMDTDRFDVIAKAPGAAAPPAPSAGPGAPPPPPVMQFDIDTLWLMLRGLLKDRFQLAVHMEERPVPAYTLTAGKPKMKKADPSSRTGCKEGPGPDGKDPRIANPVLGRLLTCQNITMTQFAGMLQNLANGYVHTPVLDSTGLEGGYDFTLSFSPAGAVNGGGGRGGGDAGAQSIGAPEASMPNGAVSLMDAVDKQLGLKMELQKRPIPVLVIDHVEEKPTDN